MPNQTTESPQRDARESSTDEQDPSELARRELIEWCERHGLPVPPEHQRPDR
jgi:hypothetical protein